MSCMNDGVNRSPIRLCPGSLTQLWMIAFFSVPRWVCQVWNEIQNSFPEKGEIRLHYIIMGGR